MPPTCRQPRGSRRSPLRKALALSKSVCLFTPSQGKKRRRQRFGIAMMRGLWYSIRRNDAKGHFVNDRNQIWMCKTCGCEFLADASPTPRVVQCPKCGDAVLLSNHAKSDSRSFWAGFLFGWWGVLWAREKNGRSGADHALAGHFIQWLVGLVLMVVVFLAALFMHWLKAN